MRNTEGTHLPGVGDRREFATGGGDVIGVIEHRDGDRELFVHDRKDPDACRLSLRLSEDEARRLAQLLAER